MSDWLEVWDDAGNFIGRATVLIAPTASVVNGRLSLPGISEGIDGLPANPTASVGLSAVNGAATTFMRSDAAPAISQSISPTWTGPHTFKGGFLVEDAGGADRIKLDSTSIELRTDNTALNVGDTFAGLVVNNDSWMLFDHATHSMDLGDVDGWGNLSHIAIEDDDEQVRLHAATVKVEMGVLEVGVAGSALGRLKLAGNTSGVVTVQPAPAAGTWTLQLPATPGTNRYPLLTNGAGVTSWTQLGAADISGLGSAAVLNVGTSSGDIPVLGAGGKLASSVIPALAISETFVVASQAAMLALSAAETGDVAVRTDLNKSFILAGTNPATLAHWQELLTPTDAVLSVNGQTGAVVLTTSHITEGSNLYYTTARFNTAFAAKTTADLAEGSNLYYTDERVDDRVAALIQGTTNQITPTYNDAGGTLTLALPQNIHTGASPQFTGLTLTGNLSAAGVASSLIPSVTDTYDLGSSTKLWRKGWLSELDAVLFAQNTVSLIGGWLMATKNEGAIPVGQDVGTGDTSIDFGQAMTTNDFVLFRAAGSVEYVQVGSVVSGTRYNVTRNLDGSGANAWPAGSVYAVLGNTTNGRIEINANSTPRMSLIKQGATYNAQTELVRVGDLNGGWNYGAETYGFAAGEYAAGKSWVSVDASNGFRVGNHTTIVHQIDTSGNVTFGQVATDSGNAYWDNTTKRLNFRGGTGGTVVQAYVDTTGAIVGAAGNLIIDSTGIRLITSTVNSFDRTYRIADATNNNLLMVGAYYDANNVTSFISASQSNVTPKGSSVTITAGNNITAGKGGYVALVAESLTYGTGSMGVSSNSAAGPQAGVSCPMVVGGTGVATTTLDVYGSGRYFVTGTANNPFDGLNLYNGTAAAAGAQQYSPRLRLTGQGWKTNTTAASQQIDWTVQAVPVQGAANPSSYLDFQSSIAGNSYTSRMTLSSAGLLTVDGIVSAATGFQISGAAASGNVLRGNGTNFVSAQLGVSDLSGFGSNVATFLATPSSANLRAALTDETGTGAAVFATSPTLVTPALGAATASSLALSGDISIQTPGGTTARSSTLGLASWFGFTNNMVYDSGANTWTLDNTSLNAGFFKVDARNNANGNAIAFYRLPSGSNPRPDSAVSVMMALKLDTGNVGIGTTSEFGSGVGVVGIKNAATAPTTNPTGGGVLYVSGGALYWRGSSGTTTMIAPA